MFVFQSPPKGGESTAEACKDTASASEPSSQETTPEKSECSLSYISSAYKNKEEEYAGHDDHSNHASV